MAKRDVRGGRRGKGTGEAHTLRLVLPHPHPRYPNPLLVAPTTTQPYVLTSYQYPFPSVPRSPTPLPSPLYPVVLAPQYKEAVMLSYGLDLGHAIHAGRTFLSKQISG